MQNQGQQFAIPQAPAGGVVPMMAPSMMPNGQMMQAGGVPMGIMGTPQGTRKVSAAGNVAMKIEHASNILVALSKDPSVDEISGALGLTMLLDTMGKHATAIYSGKTPNALKFLKPEKTFETNTNSLRDFIIALNKDKADHIRYRVEGDFVKVFITPYKTTIDEKDLEFSHGDFNVDLVISLGVKGENDLDAALAEYGRIMHDAGSINITTDETTQFGEIQWCEPKASSVCEMITKLSNEFPSKPKITPEVATALLTGVVAVTDRFMNEKTTPDVMGVASQLMQAGANQVLISMNIIENKGGKMGAQKVEEEKPAEEIEDKEMAEKMEAELEKPLEGAEEKSEEKTAEEKPEKKAEKSEEKPPESEEKSEEARALDELAEIAVAAAEESAEKMPGKVPETGPKLEIETEDEREIREAQEKAAEGEFKKEEKPAEEPEEKSEEPAEEPKEAEEGSEEKAEETEDDSKKLLDAEKFEKELAEKREEATKFGEGIPNAPKEYGVPGSDNVNLDKKEEKEDERLFEREREGAEAGAREGEEKPPMGAVKMEDIEPKKEEKEEAPKVDSPEVEEGNSLEIEKETDEDSPKDRPDTTGARNVRDLEKRKNGIILTDEMTAEDVLGEESAEASAKVLSSDIYPDIHKIPEATEEVKPRKRKDYSSMMDDALKEQPQKLEDSPIARASVGQSMPNMQALQSIINPAAQNAPEVANMPEANHIPTMEYIPDGQIQNEMPAQMTGNAAYLGTPEMAQMQQVPMQPMTPQQLAMQVMSQMGTTQQPMNGVQTPVMTPMMSQPVSMQEMPQMAPQEVPQMMPQMPAQQVPASGMEVNLPTPPAPQVDFTQMAMPVGQQPVQPMPQAVPQVMPQPVQQPTQPAPDPTAGQLYQQNDPSAFHIPGM